MCNLSFIYLYICNRACAHGCTRTKTGRRNKESFLSLAICPEICPGLCIPISNYFEMVLILISARFYARTTKHMIKKKPVLYKMHKARRKKIFHFFLKIVHFEVEFGFQSCYSMGVKRTKLLNKRKTRRGNNDYYHQRRARPQAQPY